MNKLCLLVFLLLFICGERKRSNEWISKFPIHPVGNFTNERVDTLDVDLNRSSIKWKGTKMMGLGSHEGEISIQKGYLIVKEEQLTGGEITVDMRSIKVTDIPPSDPIPIRNLTNHLKSPDFFHVDNYPLSHLKISSVQNSKSNTKLVTGSLMIKGVSNPVSFEVKNKGRNNFEANLHIDRFDWDIAYSGSWIDRTLVDREIELWVELSVK